MSAEPASCLPRTKYAVPGRGYVLSTAVEELAGDLRVAAKVLSTKQIEPNVREVLGASLSGSSKWTEREIWMAVGVWIVAAIKRSITSGEGGSAALQWFAGRSDLSSPSFDAVVRDHLLGVARDPRTGDLLPYLFDVHGPGSRLSVRKDPSTAHSRARKKKSGVFYTPADVADFMVHSVLSGHVKHSPPTFLDPAVGTGVFLRAALAQLRSRYPERSPLELVTAYLFGIDVDGFALDGAAFVLLHDVIQTSALPATPKNVWHTIRANLVSCDSLKIVRSGAMSGQIALSDVFPSLSEGADIVLGNPPYAAIGTRDDFQTLCSQFATVPNSAGLKGDLYPVFVEQMVRLGNDEGSGAMVVPLSLACNSGRQFVACRQVIQSAPGTWRFAFFDREPHALFGEDVKTRNAIVLRNRSLKGGTQVYTGPLRRWRGETRSALFGSISFTEIRSPIAAGIPKIQGRVQSEALAHFHGKMTLGSLLLNVGRTTLDQLPMAHKCEVLVGPTAYNFLNVARATILPLSKGERLSENPLHRLMALDAETASTVYAILSSSFAFWWWYISGDGFHVNVSALLAVPVGDLGVHQSRLAELGNEIWREVRRNPSRSSNRGRVTFAYPSTSLVDLRAQVDDLVRKSLGLGEEFGASLNAFVSTVVDARLFGPTQ